jgi:hypothetical protein
LLLALATVAGCGGDPSGQLPESQQPAAIRTAASERREEVRHIVLRDDCDPADPAWAPAGCLHAAGDVARSEFDLLATSPLSLAEVGHPAWRIDPSYQKLEDAGAVLVTNTGGRGHTFTPVAAFGGGRVAALNKGLAPAPECALAPGAVDPSAVAPGSSLQVSSFAPGLHRFQCCIHPWMRAVVRVKPKETDDGR